jgi:hypothetical protein
MIATEKTVREFELVSETRPHLTFTVRADTPEKAARKLIADLRAVIVELQETKGQNHNKTA